MKKSLTKTTNEISKKSLFGFCFDILLIILSIVGIVFLFTVPIVKWDKTATVSGPETFKYFTTDSNVLLLLSCIVCVVFQILFWNKKIKQLPLFVYVFKHTATVAVSLTMFVTVFLLTPGAIILNQYPASSLYMGSNLLFHLINPLIAIVSFLLFQNSRIIKYKHTFWCLIPLIIYGIFYLSMAYTHVQMDGTIPTKYDWYKFCSFGFMPAPVMFILLSGFYYLIGWMLWFFNRKIKIKFLEK